MKQNTEDNMEYVEHLSHLKGRVINSAESCGFKIYLTFDDGSWTAIQALDQYEDLLIQPELVRESKIEAADMHWAGILTHDEFKIKQDYEFLLAKLECHSKDRKEYKRLKKIFEK